MINPQKGIDLMNNTSIIKYNTLCSYNISTLLCMLCNMSMLLRPSLVGFLVNQPLYAMLLQLDHLDTMMTFDGLLNLGDILTVALSFFLAHWPLTFNLAAKACLEPFVSLLLLNRFFHPSCCKGLLQSSSNFRSTFVEVMFKVLIKC
jgi:hypothetical protein